MTDAIADDTETSFNVGFRIEGKFLADLARTRVSEGAWERALSLLTDSLHGLGTDDAIALLKGEADLTGWSSDEDGIGLERLPADGPLAKEVRARLDYLYGTVFRENDRYFKPYARVQGWFEDDYRFSRKFEGTPRILDATSRSNKVRYNALDNYRTLYYAKDPHRDLLVLVELDHVEQAEILCEEVSIPPIWYQVPHNRTAEFLAGKLRVSTLGLQMRGAHQYLPREDVAPRSDVKPLLVVDEDEAVAPAPEAPATQVSDADSAPAEVIEPTEEEVAAQAAVAAATKTLNAARTSAAARRALSAFSKGMEGCTDRGELGTLRTRFNTAMNDLERRMSMPLLDERDRLYTQWQDLYEKVLGKQVAEQADAVGGWLELKLVDKHLKTYRKQPTLRVPRNPFLLWALRGVDFEAHDHARPEWSVVSPMGMKMINDDVMHTDWMLGAGLSLEDTYEGDEASLHNIVRSSATFERFRLVEEYTGAKFVTLAKGPHTFISGVVVHAKPNEGVPAGSIAIAPHAGPEYQLAMETACRKNEDGDEGVLICETGGKLAHLATVGRELNCTVLMLPDAARKMHKGSRWHINLSGGTLHQFV